MKVSDFLGLVEKVVELRRDTVAKEEEEEEERMNGPKEEERGWMTKRWSAGLANGIM